MARGRNKSADGPWALVTGASSGIGAAFARALVGRGERVVVVARRVERLRALQEELGGADQVDVITLDLARPEGPARLEAELGKRGREIDLLVNNAGRGDTGRFVERPVEASLEVIDLNVRTTVELCARLVPAMAARGRGRVVNVVSMSAFQPVPFFAVYAASKSFLLSFTESLAVELEGTGVRVQALCPGNIRTEFQQVAGTDKVLFDKTPASPPEDVVAASLAGLERGTLVVIPGLQNRLTVAAQSLVPRSLTRRLAGELFRPR